MKNKIVNPLTISLATSMLFLSTPKASAINISSQTVQNQPLLAVFYVARSKHQTQKIESSQANRTKTQTAQSGLGQSGNVSDPLGGLLVSLVLTTYILLGLWYRRYRIHQIAILIQQVETLERIWKIKSRQ
jgi:hypothetical protein